MLGPMSRDSSRRAWWRVSDSGPWRAWDWLVIFMLAALVVVLIALLRVWAAS